MSRLDAFKENATEEVTTPFEQKQSFTKQNSKPVRLRDDYHKKIKVYTAIKGGSISGVVEQAVKEYMEKHDLTI